MQESGVSERGLSPGYSRGGTGDINCRVTPTGVLQKLAKPPPPPPHRWVITPWWSAPHTLYIRGGFGQGRGKGVVCVAGRRICQYSVYREINIAAELCHRAMLDLVTLRCASAKNSSLTFTLGRQWGDHKAKGSRRRRKRSHRLENPQKHPSLPPPPLPRPRPATTPGPLAMELQDLRGTGTMEEE